MSGRGRDRGEVLERELGALLRGVPVPPPDPEVERRGLELALAAQAARPGASEVAAPGSTTRRPRQTAPLPRLAAAFVVVLLTAGLFLTPAWAAVRDWVGTVFDSTPAPVGQIGLGHIPGGGRLLVLGEHGPWVVAPDGSRRRLGGYAEASWSPHGLYVAAAAGRELSAVTPAGDRHWTLRAPAAVHDPRWGPSGELIAYRAGRELRVVAGDGSEDRPLDESVATLPPAWGPKGTSALAYVDARGTLRVVDPASGRPLARGRALPGIERLEWSRRGGEILEASGERLRMRRVELDGAKVHLARPRSLPLPRGANLVDAALSPSGPVAAILQTRHGRVHRGEVVLFDAGDGSSRRLMSVPGHLSQLAWSPRGQRLLVAWPEADEWLFLPAGRARGRAMTAVARAFPPAAGARFPTVAGWCCRR